MSRSLWMRTVAALGAMGFALPAVAQPQMCPRNPDGTLTEESLRTVVITDPEVFRHADFSLGRALGGIIKTVPEAEKLKAVDKPSERVALLATLLRSFRVLDRVNPESQVPMPAIPRPGEEALDAQDLLDPNNAKDFLRPVGLFNRLDLTPENKRYCGEHRIVYAKGGDAPPIFDRFFLIFEAAIQNPDPQDRARGCQRIADFWDTMKASDDPAVLAPKLASFYFGGDLGDNLGIFPPVVHHAHFGFPFGQIRGNMFVGGDWELREWRTSVSADGYAVFIPDTVKSNPHPDLYASEVPNDPGLADLLSDFHESVRINHTRELLELELNLPDGTPRPDGSAPSADELFARLSARFENRFNTFGSVSQSDQHDPWTRAQGSKLAEQVDQELQNFNFPGGQSLTAQHVFNRAGALSCAGCHQQSVGDEIAPGMPWPPTVRTPPGFPIPFDFVHINERGELSEALTRHFLPSRCDNLQTIISPAAVAEAPEPVSEEGLEAQLDIRLEAFAAAEGGAAKTQTLQQVEQSVDLLRSQDARSPGAFIPFRRTH